MEIKIDVDELQFKEVLNKQLRDMPEDIIQKIIMECIREYFTQNNYEMIDKLFVQSNKDYYGFEKKSATEFLNRLIEECDYSKLQDIVDLAILDLRHNYNDILIDVLTLQLLQSFRNSNFESGLNMTIRDILNARKGDN